VHFKDHQISTSRISPCQVPHSLASITSPNIRISTFEKPWPKEIGLKDLGGGLVYPSMASI